MKRYLFTLALLMLSMTIFAQQPTEQDEKEKELVQQLYQAQISGNDSAFYKAQQAFMDYLEQKNEWEKYYRTWMNRVVYEVNNKNFYRAFSEIYHLADDMNERDMKQYLYIPSMALGLFYNSRNQPEMGEQHFRRALQSIDTERDPVSTFNCYLSLAQSLSFRRPAEAMACLDSLPQQMLQNPMYESGVLGYRCIIANKMGDDEAFDRYFAQYDSIRQNLPEQFNAANLEQVMVCRCLMLGDYDGALAWCDSLEVPLTATELRLNVYEKMGEWELAFRASELKDSLTHAAEREVLEEHLMAITDDLNALQAEQEKAEARRKHLIVVAVMAFVIISMLIGMLIYRYQKNRRLKEQYQQLQEARNSTMAAQARRRAIVSTMHQMLESPVNLLLGYARAYNDSHFQMDPEMRIKRYRDIISAARSIESLIDPVLDTYVQGTVGMTDEQKQICRDALRSPLLTLIGSAEIIADANGQIPHDEYMQMRAEVCRDAYHVATSTHELVVFSLYSDDTLTPKTDRIGLNEIANSILNSYDLHRTTSPFGAEKERSLSPEFRTNVADDVTVEIHPLLQELVNCLLANADKYATGGNVVVECLTCDDGTYAIAVSNEGPAIPAADAERIFEPFVRLSPGSHSLGIGLALARRLAATMGYTLTLDKAYTKGARFIVSGI